MGEAEGVQRVYTFARHCSPNPSLASRDIEVHRQNYYASKKGAKPREGELLGIHFFMSYSRDDNPPVEVMNKISLALAEHPLLRDYATFGANHFDKACRHTHTYVCQFSAIGKPRKMGLQRAELDELKRYANRLCVEHGLSIIDTKSLRANKEYSDWVDSVIAEGTVVVHAEKNEPRARRRKNTPAKNYYYKWQKQHEEQAEEEDRILTSTQRNRKNFEATYFYTTDGNPDSRWYVSGNPQKRFYVVPLVSNRGYRLSNLELTVRFVLSIAKSEGSYIKRQDSATWLEYHAEVDEKLQGMYDYLATANQMNVQKPDQISERIADVGKQMNALRREKSRHEKSIEVHERIIKAYETYQCVRSMVEGVPEPDPSLMNEYKEAYAILSQNQILTTEAYVWLCRRYDFEKKKIGDYENRIPELKRQYHALKKLEALAIHATEFLHKIYAYSNIAHERFVDCARYERDIDALVTNARNRVCETSALSESKKEK